MAIPFQKPKDDAEHPFTAANEMAALNQHFKKRKVPKSAKGKLLLGSWNIANLGVQKRKAEALQIIAHILKRFDLIAVQEVNSNFEKFEEVMSILGRDFDYVMTDPAGNTERLAYVYRLSKVKRTNLCGEVALRDRQFPKRSVKVRWKDKNKIWQIDTFKNMKFRPFDRNPFICSFRAGTIEFTLVNVHLFYGKAQNSKKREDREKYARRVLEIFALARWANRRLKSEHNYDPDIVLLGDMNIPAMKKTESTYKALVRYGWNPIEYKDGESNSQTGGTNLGNDKTYDQMVFAPGSIGKRVIKKDVFDFDNAIFRNLWNDYSSRFTAKVAPGKFNRHVKYHISDHRPVWVQVKTD